MDTAVGALSKVLFGQSRRPILSLLYGRADQQFYLREIARRAGTGIGATRRELGQLTDTGLIYRVRRGHQVYYQANRQNPIFAELKSILAKTSGIRDVLNEALAPLKPPRNCGQGLEGRRRDRRIGRLALRNRLQRRTASANGGTRGCRLPRGPGEPPLPRHSLAGVDRRKRCKVHSGVRRLPKKEKCKQR